MKTRIQTLFFFLLVTQICLAQWVQTNGPYGGRISALVTDGLNLYAGTDNGVYISTNMGSNWKLMSSGIPSGTGIISFAIIGSNLFAGTDGNGVFLSTNNGTSWSEANSGLQKNAYVNALTVDSNERGGFNLFASDGRYFHDTTSYPGVYISTNNGINWSVVKAKLIFPIFSLAIIGKNLYGGRPSFWEVNGGLFRFIDNDTSWTVDTVISNNSINCLAVKDTNLFVGTCEGVLLSTDNGSSWTQVSTGLPLNTCVNNLAFNGNNLFAQAGWEGGEIYLSTNNGSSWVSIYSDLHPNSWVSSISDFAFIPNSSDGTNIYAGTRYGVHLSIDHGTSWTEVNTGIISNDWIYDITAIPNSGNESNFIACTGMYVYISLNSGISWSKIDKFDDYHTFSFLVSPNDTGGYNIFAGGTGVFISKDNGINWKSTGLTNTRVFCFARNGSNIFAGTEDKGVFLSSNNGTSWSPVNSGFKIDAVQFLYLNGINLFAGTNSSLFLSTNDGGKWTEIIKGLPKDKYEHFGIRDLVARESELFLGTSHGIFRSTDNGDNWIDISSELNDQDIEALAISPDGTILFAGTYGKGVFFSSDNGTKWIEINSGLTNLNITKLYIDPEGKNIFAGTGQAGLWYRPLSEMIIPVELTSFSATVNGKEVTLDWSTATELNNQGFEVQRKFGANDFVTVGSVKGHGTTTSPNQYTFVDKLIDEGKYFYRLKQMDYGGQYNYSQTVEVDVRTLDKFALEQNYPNPFNPTTTIGYVLQEKSNAKLTLLNAIGEEMAVLLNEEQEKGYHKVEFYGSKLPSGVYFYHLVAGNFNATRKLLLLK